MNEELFIKAKKRILLDQILRGIKKVFTSKIYMALVILIYVTLGIILAITVKGNSDIYNAIVMPFILILLFLGLMMLFGYIPGSLKIYDRLYEAGFVNKAGIPPELTGQKKKDGLLIWEFRASGIPLERWEDNQASLEAAMNISVIKFKPLDGKAKMLVYSVPAIGDLPEVCEWDDGLLPDRTTVLRIGEGLAGPIEIDFHSTPHILVGGSTGSGKTIFIKLIMHECIMHGAQVILTDFKGGVDFSSKLWTQLNGVCTDLDSVIKALKNLVALLAQRRDILLASGLSNIDEYNKLFGNRLQHIFFVCDEVAEMLDQTGVDKETKEKIKEITALLATIARLGRAFGIHLVLGTQRPDANILPGQIKNNMDVRICGRSDQVLSQIILDKSDAADKISKDAQGRFLMSDGTIFQAYYFDDKKDDYSLGEY